MKRIKNIVLIPLLTSIICILAPISIPIGPIPISMATLIIMLISTLFEKRIAMTSVILYIILGIVGLPVFSNMQGGVFVILSPTGGFIIGYILFSFIIVNYYNKDKKIIKNFLVLLIANIVLYIIGIIYFTIITKSAIWYSFTVCVLPFIIIDILKIIVVLIISNKIKFLTIMLIFNV